MLLSEVEGSLVDDFEDLALVVTLTQNPELLEQLHAEKVLLWQDFENLIRPLHELQVCFLRIP